MDMILHGREVYENIADEIKKNVKKLSRSGIYPKLATVRAGNDEKAIFYENNIETKLKEFRIETEKFSFDHEIKNEDFLNDFSGINNREDVHGVILLKPLPEHIDDESLKNIIRPEKDVDCFGNINKAKLYSGCQTGFVPCISEAVMELLQYYEIKLQSKKVVIIGRSMNAGKPLAMMMLENDATVTICHTLTKDLPEITRESDILVSAAGRPNYFGREYVSGHTIVIDVGVNRDSEGKLCGDFNYSVVCNKVKCITPVPGGISLVAPAVLARHVMRSALKLLK